MSFYSAILIPGYHSGHNLEPPPISPSHRHVPLHTQGNPVLPASRRFYSPTWCQALAFCRGMTPAPPVPKVPAAALPLLTVLVLSSAGSAPVAPPT